MNIARSSRDALFWKVGTSVFRFTGAALTSALICGFGSAWLIWGPETAPLGELFEGFFEFYSVSFIVGGACIGLPAANWAMSKFDDFAERVLVIVCAAMLAGLLIGAILGNFVGGFFSGIVILFATVTTTFFALIWVVSNLEALRRGSLL